jgi:hypothetical protein
LNQEDINYLNICIKRNQIEIAIKSLPNKEKPRLSGFAVAFCQAIKQELIPTLLKLFHELEMEGTLVISFHEASIILIPKTDKDTTTKKRELSANLFNEHRCKNSQ